MTSLVQLRSGRRRSSFRVLALLAGLTLPLAFATAATPPAAEPPELSSPTATGLESLRPQLDAKDYAGALATLDRLLATTTVDSFDEVVLNQLKAQVLLASNRYTEATAALERVLAIDSARPTGAAPYLNPTQRRDVLYYLAQLTVQEAGGIKGDPAAQRTAFTRALGYARSWHRSLTAPTADNDNFLASLLYTVATSNPAAADPDLLREARSVAEGTLRRQVVPPESIRLVLVGAAQLLQDNPAAIDQLELLAEQNPKNASYWSQLAGLYLTEASALETRDAKAARGYHLRAIVTLERAQALGLLHTPAEHLSLIGLYLNLGQPTQAARLLRAALDAGRIENTRRNWELLASALQQSGHLEAAIASLADASARLPAEPQLQFQAGQLLYSLEKVSAAYDLTVAATRNPGRLETPGSARLFAAYLAYELKRFPEARAHLDDATAFPDARPDEIDRLRTALKSTEPAPRSDT